MPKRPKRLKVGCIVYPIKWGHATTPEGEDVNGYIHFGPSQPPHVAVNTDGHVDRTEVLLHELIHAVMHDRALGDLLGEDEEMFVSSFTYGLMAVLRDNKGLAEWLVNPDA